MEIKRGEIWWASLPAPKGSEPGFDRPVLIIQANKFNRSKIQTAVVAALTANQLRSEVPGMVSLAARSSGLKRDSVINLTQLLTVDKDVLEEKIGEVSSRTMTRVDAELKSVLALG